MEYTYNNITYKKRPLTNDIALSVVSNDFSLAESKSPEFEKLTKPIKLGELAAQHDACPVADLSNFRPYIDFLKQEFEGFRIRNAQFSGVIAAGGILNSVDDDTAAYLAANGSIAVIAQGYRNNSDAALLKKGIIPLISEEELPTGTFILIRNIKRDISDGKLEAYIVTPDKLTSVGIHINKYTAEDLTAVLT